MRTERAKLERLINYERVVEIHLSNFRHSGYRVHGSPHGAEILEIILGISDVAGTGDSDFVDSNLTRARNRAYVKAGITLENITKHQYQGLEVALFTKFGKGQEREEWLATLDAQLLLTMFTSAEV